MLNLNDTDPKGLIIDLDLLRNEATVLKYGEFNNINAIKNNYVQLVNTLNAATVIIDLGSPRLALTIAQQSTICEYVMDHTLSSITYNLAFAIYTSNVAEAMNAISTMLKA